MKETICKTLIKNNKYQAANKAVKLPLNAQITSAGIWKTEFVVWYRIKEEDESNIKAFKFIWMFMDNETIPEGNFRFIDTIIVDGGTWVYHIYEQIEDQESRDILIFNKKVKMTDKTKTIIKFGVGSVGAAFAVVAVILAFL